MERRTAWNKINGLRDQLTGKYIVEPDALYWAQNHTRTQDKHWKESGAASPFRPFPDKPYFREIQEFWNDNPILWIEKSRDLMCSWMIVMLYTHQCQIRPNTQALFQSQKELKAYDLVEYARTLYREQDEWLRKKFPLIKPMDQQSTGTLKWANGSEIIGIPEGGDQVRSHHPWGLFMDEAAFQPAAGEAYNVALPVCEKITVISTAGPGWFAQVVNEEEVEDS